MRRRGRVAAWAPVLLAGWLGACRGEPRRERLQHGRFESVELRIPDRARGVVLVLARPEDAAVAERVSAAAAARQLASGSRPERARRALGAQLSRRPEPGG